MTIDEDEDDDVSEGCWDGRAGKGVVGIGGNGLEGGAEGGGMLADLPIKDDVVDDTEPGRSTGDRMV
jgi:hypothetical protein